MVVLSYNFMRFFCGGILKRLLARVVVAPALHVPHPLLLLVCCLVCEWVSEVIFLCIWRWWSRSALVQCLCFGEGNADGHDAVVCRLLVPELGHLVFGGLHVHL